MGTLVLTRHPGRSLLVTEPGDRQSVIKVQAVSREGACLQLTTPDGSETQFVEHGSTILFAGGSIIVQPGWGIAKGQARLLLDYPAETKIVREELVQ